MNKQPCINEIRNFSEIQSIINQCQGFGRTWGKSGSQYHGSHIVFIKDNEIVLLYQHRQTKHLKIDCFVKNNANQQVLFQQILNALHQREVFPETE
jgi:hypothetical protein